MKFFRRCGVLAALSCWALVGAPISQEKTVIHADKVQYTPSRKLCAAWGKVVVRRGPMLAIADCLEVLFVPHCSQVRIDHLLLRGHGKITTPALELSGEHILYKVPHRYLEVTGAPTLITKEGLWLKGATISYDAKAQKGKALQGVMLRQEGHCVTAQEMEVTFQDTGLAGAAAAYKVPQLTPGPRTKLRQVRAVGEVVWTYQDVRLLADTVTYTPSTGCVVGEGHVAVYQKDSFLTGHRCIFNIHTKKATLFSSGTSAVRALWAFPRKKAQRPPQKRGAS